MSSGRRITVALVGLVLLAVVGYLVGDQHGHAGGGAGHQPVPVSATATPH